MSNLTGLTGLVIRKLVDFELKIGRGTLRNAHYAYLGKRKEVQRMRSNCEVRHLNRPSMQSMQWRGFDEPSSLPCS
jgi:hypothetical protein